MGRNKEAEASRQRNQDRKGQRRRGGRNDAEVGWKINPNWVAGVFGAVLLCALAMKENAPLERMELDYPLALAMQSCLEHPDNRAAGDTGLRDCVAEDALDLLAQGANPNAHTHARAHKFGYHLIHLAAQSNLQHSESLLGGLIEAGGDANRKATKGDRRTPLYVAAVNGQVGKARMLLEAGADVNAGDRLGTSPLFIAAQDGDVDMIELLLSFGANVHKPTTEGWYSLNVAASECLEMRNDRKICDGAKRPCEHLSPMENGIASFARVVELLLEAGADPLQDDVEGSPALHYAVWCDSMEMVRTLLRHGADVNKNSLTGEPRKYYPSNSHQHLIIRDVSDRLLVVTALWVAAKRGDLEMVNVLLDEGADPIQPIKVNPDSPVFKGGGAGGAGNTVWFAAEMAANNGYIAVADRINRAVKDLSAETASEMGVDYADVRDTVRHPTCNKMMDILSDRAEGIAKKKNEEGWSKGCGAGGDGRSEADKLFPMVTATTQPPPPPPPLAVASKAGPGADLRMAMGSKVVAGVPTSASAMAAAIGTSNTINTVLAGDGLTELSMANYPTEGSTDKRIALMRLVLWAAGTADNSIYYGLDPTSAYYAEDQAVLRSRAQALLGAGDVHVLPAFQRLDADGDSSLALVELQELGTFLTRMDQDGDGKLSQKELFSDEADAGVGEHRTPLAKPTDPDRVVIDAMMAHRAICCPDQPDHEHCGDLNHDGILSDAESRLILDCTKTRVLNPFKKTRAAEPRNLLEGVASVAKAARDNDSERQAIAEAAQVEQEGDDAEAFLELSSQLTAMTDMMDLGSRLTPSQPSAAAALGELAERHERDETLAAAAAGAVPDEAARPEEGELELEEELRRMRGGLDAASASWRRR